MITPESPETDTRGYRINLSKNEVIYPPCDPDLLRKFQATGMAIGGEAISWTDLKHFCEMTITDLSPGEAEAIIQASAAFASAIVAYNGNALVAPFGYEVEQRDKVSDMLKAAFQSLMQGRGQ